MKPLPTYAKVILIFDNMKPLPTYAKVILILTT